MNPYDVEKKAADSAEEKINPARNSAHEHWSSGRGKQRGVLMGLILIGVGSIFMLKEWGYIYPFWFQYKFHWWYIVLMVLASNGLWELLDAKNLRQVGKGLFLIGLSFWLFACFDHLWGWTFANSWPVILIALGLNVVLRGLSGRKQC